MQVFFERTFTILPCQGCGKASFASAQFRGFIVLCSFGVYV